MKPGRFIKKKTATKTSFLTNDHASDNTTYQ